jgi:hypothetical protein
VGAGEFLEQLRFPPMMLPLTSEALPEELLWIATLPTTVPWSARQGAALLLQMKSPPIVMPGPTKPLCWPQASMSTLWRTAMPPSEPSRTTWLQPLALRLPPIVTAIAGVGADWPMIDNDAPAETVTSWSTVARLSVQLAPNRNDYIVEVAVQNTCACCIRQGVSVVLAAIEMVISAIAERFRV